jgi:hypothetical protein
VVEVRLKNDKMLYGDVSYVDHANEQFWLLGQDDLGMIGQKVGTCLPFADCIWVRTKTTPSGPFDSDCLADYVRQAKKWVGP